MTPAPKTLLDRLEDRDRMSGCGAVGVIGPSIFRQAADRIRQLEEENAALRAKLAEHAPSDDETRPA